MSGANGERRWVLTDAVGRVWLLSVGGAGAPLSGAAASATSRARGAVDAQLEAWLVEAFAPEGMRSRSLAAALLEVTTSLTGRPTRGALERDMVRDARRLIEELRDVLLRASRSGVLRVDEARRVAPQIEEPAPDTLREPPAPPIADTSRFELRVVDEAGVPVGGLEVEFSVGGSRRKVTTNGAGVAKHEGADASFGSARVVSASALEDIVKPRWETLRPVKLPTGDEASIRTLRDIAASVSLESEKPHTLAVVPHHHRVRLAGMHFDTNKSFLLPSAMRGIRKVKSMYDQIDTTQFLVVGHTDTHGTQAYNEKLSLERAKSIVAFLKDDVDAWNTLFAAAAPEKRWGDREINAMLSALPEGGPPFTAANRKARDSEAIKQFQQFSNDTRGTALEVDGKAGPETKRALIEAYMALDHTSLPKGASIVAHGCGPNHPPPDEGDVPPTDDERRRVDIFAFDGPIRPPPPGETSGPGSPEYPQWVSQMQSTFDVDTEVLPFRYAMEIGKGQQWSEAARLTMISEDLLDIESFVLANGESAGTLRIFEFSGIRPGVRYRADVTEGDLAMELFAFTELHAVARDDSATNHLRPAPADPSAPFDLDSDPDDHGILEVRLFDADGNVMKNTAYRLSVGDQNVGYAENGVASIRLPPSPPANATLEWGELDDRGVLPYRMEVALDCDDQADRTSSMLHNLGYPRSLPLDTRVRSFQARHPVGEAGLGPGGLVPPKTRAEIVKVYRQKVG